MTTLKRILAWWAAYTVAAWSLAMTMALPSRIGSGYSPGEALSSAMASYFPMMTLTLVPAFMVLFAWALVIERRPDWETADLSMVASSGVMAIIVALGIGLLGVNPAFAWRTGSYIGDAAQATMANLTMAWLCLLLARLVVRNRIDAPSPSLTSAAS